MTDEKKVRSEEFRAKVRELTKEVGGTDHIYVVCDRETSETFTNVETTRGDVGMMMAAAVVKSLAAGMNRSFVEVAAMLFDFAKHEAVECSGSKLVD